MTIDTRRLARRYLRLPYRHQHAIAAAMGAPGPRGGVHLFRSCRGEPARIALLDQLVADATEEFAS